MEFPSKILIAQEESEEQQAVNDSRSPVFAIVMIIILAGIIYVFTRTKIIGALLMLIYAIGMLILMPALMLYVIIGIAIAIIMIIWAVIDAAS